MFEEMTPDRLYRKEIEGALEKDVSRVGDVFRATRADVNRAARSIADELGIGTPGPVYSAMKSIETLLEGKRLAGGPTYASQKASMLREFSRRHAESLSETTKQRLLELSVEHDKVAKNQEAIARENEEIEMKEQEWTKISGPGIYVYTYPHYMRFPVLATEDADTNSRTYLKIGMSDSDMAKRITDQIKTSMPEPPLVLRMYRVPANGNTVNESEKILHNHLNAADHNRNRQKGAGKEWFLTHLPFVDSTASLLGLEELYRHAEDQ